MEVKLQNLDDIPYVSEMAQNVLGSFFFMNTIFVLDTVQMSARVSSFH